MEKQVSLEFYPRGQDPTDGFQVSLEVRSGKTDWGASTGQLRFPTDVLAYYVEWQKAYYKLSDSDRQIKVKSIELDGPLNQRRKKCQRSALTLQTAFNQWLDDPSFLPLQTKWSTWVSPEDHVRVLIRTEMSELWKLPWHQWQFLRSYPTIEVGFSRLAYEAPRTNKPAVHHVQIRILAILGNATGIDIEQDRQFLERFPYATVTFLTEPRRREVQTYLLEQAWDILFFAGHSSTETGIQSTGRIYLNTEDSLTLTELRGTLTYAVRQGLQLAIFNSCDGLGLAYELEQLHIPTLIVMREPIPDRVAQTFLKSLLKAFAETTSLYQAVQQARVQLEGLEDQYPCASWLPVICQNPAVPPFQWSSLPAKLSHSSFGQRLKRAIAMSLTLAGLTIGFRWMGWLQGAELWAFDQLMRWKPEELMDDRLLIVQATESDIRQYGWPLSDTILAELLAKLQQANPRVIGLDMLRDRPQEPGYRSLLQQFQQNDRIVAVCKHSEQDDLGTPPPALVPMERVGFNDVIPDADDTIRRIILLMDPVDRSNCVTESAFSVVVVQQYLAADQIQTRFSPEGFLQMGTVVFYPLDPNVGAYYRADLAGHQVLMNYRHRNGSLANIAQQVSITDVLTDKVDKIIANDRIVLIGITATSVKDEFKTPYPENLRGLLLHAQIVSQLLSTVLEQRPFLKPLPKQGDFIWISGWALFGGITACWIDSHRQRSIGIIISILVLFGGCFWAFVNGLWIPLIPAVLAFLSSNMTVSYLSSKNLTSPKDLS